MRVEVKTEQNSGYDYYITDPDRAVEVAYYYDNTGALIGRSYDEQVYCLISDRTEEKLSRIVKSAGVDLTAERKWRLCCGIDTVFSLAEFQFLASHSIRNQEALRQLINAFEALGLADQTTLMHGYRSAIGVSHGTRFPLGTRDTPVSSFVETAQKFLGKGEGGTPPTFQGVIVELQREMKTQFSSFGLDPEIKHMAIFDKWMKTLRKDPAIKEVENRRLAHEKEAEALLKEKMPDTARGTKIVTSAIKGGDANTEVIREKHGGSILKERALELEKRLKGYRKRGLSHSRACTLLAQQSDVPWVAEYLRKQLKS